MDLLKEVINQQTDKICKTYKIEPSEVNSLLTQKINSNQEISNLINYSESLKEVYRTRLFKDFIKKTKKEIYYDLRTYQKESEVLVDSHISSKERSPYINMFLKQIDNHLKDVETILDIGGGLFPASFPFDNYPNLKYYIWIDKDVRSYEALKKENINKLYLYNYDIGENNWEEYLPEGVEKFDFVFMLKLIPVIARQEKELLNKLLSVPFDQALITGSKEAMVKKIDIEKREDTTILKFIEEGGWGIIEKIDIPNEFGYIVD